MIEEKKNRKETILVTKKEVSKRWNFQRNSQFKFIVKIARTGKIFRKKNDNGTYSYWIIKLMKIAIVVVEIVSKKIITIREICKIHPNEN